MPSPPIYESFSSAAEVVDAVETILGSQLGRYHYTINGLPQDSPAIFLVDNPDTDPPREWQREGIEVLVYEPSVRGHDYLGTTGLDIIYQIKVIQHDRTQKLFTAKSTLLTGLPFKERSHLAATLQDQEELNLLHTQTQIG
jgi:hypothetical protein